MTIEAWLIAHLPPESGPWLVLAVEHWSFTQGALFALFIGIFLGSAYLAQAWWEGQR
jgi:hypothetical protein